MMAKARPDDSIDEGFVAGVWDGEEELTEITSRLRINFKDHAKRTTIIDDVEQFRGNGEDVSTAFRAALRVLFNLPFDEHTPLPMSLNDYFTEMEKLLVVHHPVIKSLQTIEVSCKEDAWAVAEPFIKLLMTGRLSRDEWNASQCQHRLTALLHSYDLIDKLLIERTLAVISSVSTCQQDTKVVVVYCDTRGLVTLNFDAVTPQNETLTNFVDKQVFNLATLTDLKLFQIAERMLPKCWFKVGLQLGFDAVELHHLEVDYERQTVARTIFEMLVKWRNRRLAVQFQHGHDSIEELRCVFTDTENVEALKVLEKCLQ